MEQFEHYEERKNWRHRVERNSHGEVLAPLSLRAVSGFVAQITTKDHAHIPSLGYLLGPRRCPRAVQNWSWPGEHPVLIV